MNVGTRITGIVAVVGAWTREFSGEVVENDATPDEYGNVVRARVVTQTGIEHVVRIGEVVDGVWAGYVEDNANVEVQAYEA